VTVNFHVEQRPNLEMLAVHCQTFVEILEHWLFALKEDRARRLVPHVSAALIHFAFDDAWISLTLVETDNKRVNDHFGVVAVVVALSGAGAVTLQAVATVEELAYVTTRVNVEHKFTAWVVVDELGDVKHHIIKDHEPLASLELVVEFSSRPVGCVLLNKELIILLQELSVVVLMNSENRHDKCDIECDKPGRSMRANSLVCVDHSRNNTSANCCLHPQEHKVAEVHVNSLHFEHTVRVPFIGATSLEPGEDTAHDQHEAEAKGNETEGRVVEAME